jgi:hypothetical protein
MGNAASRKERKAQAKPNTKTQKAQRSTNTKKQQAVAAIDYRGTLYVERNGKLQQVPDAKIGEELQQQILTELETYVEKYPNADRDYSVRSNVPAGLIYVAHNKPSPLKFSMDKKNYVIQFTATAFATAS